jgi:hypothetical protein
MRGGGDNGPYVSPSDRHAWDKNLVRNIVGTNSTATAIKRASSCRGVGAEASQEWLARAGCFKMHPRSERSLSAWACPGGWRCMSAMVTNGRMQCGRHRPTQGVVKSTSNGARSR